MCSQVRDECAVMCVRDTMGMQVANVVMELARVTKERDELKQQAGQVEVPIQKSLVFHPRSSSFEFPCVYLFECALIFFPYMRVSFRCISSCVCFIVKVHLLLGFCVTNYVSMFVCVGFL